MRHPRALGVVLLLLSCSAFAAPPGGPGDDPPPDPPSDTGANNNKDTDNKEDERTDRYEARGLEKPPTVPFGQRLRASFFYFLPLVINGLALQTTDGLSSQADPRFIKQAGQDVPTPFKWGFLPKLSFRTGPPQLGANVFMREGRFAVTGGFLLGSSDDYGRSVSVSWQKPVGGPRMLKVGLELLDLSDTKHKFYGIGARPQTDPRSAFLPDTTAEYGVYQHKTFRVGSVVGLRLNPRSEAFFSTQYIRQTALVPEADEELPNAFDKVFDVTQLPGAESPSEQVWSELAYNYDTRRHRAQLEPGFGVSGYGGASFGVDGDHSRSLRLGGEVVAYLPVVRQNRLIVPRLILDTVTNLADDVPFPFMDYPRQLPFRNVNTAVVLLRQDQVMLNASVEYQWPLTKSFAAGLFSQAVFVGRSMGTLMASQAPWDVGLKVELHTPQVPILAAWVAYGRNGFYIWFQAGIVEKSNDRWRWY